MGKQDKQLIMNSFYSVTNFVTIKITMPPDKWESLRTARPAGEWHHVAPPSRYEWHTADSVTISASNSANSSNQGPTPPQPVTYTNVGIIKKSFAGSFSTTKPSLRLDFTKYNKDNKGIEDVIGTNAITLNNSVQDPSLVRQPIGYQLFRDAGVPAFRCNLASVSVNEAPPEAYVNIEPFKKRFLQNNFNGNDKGNAYEIEWGDDLRTDVVDLPGRVTFEGFSEHSDKRDVILAANLLKEQGVSALLQIVDMDAFLRVFAMETILKHWDGYTQQTNNAFLYNDVEAVADPRIADLKFKVVPSGIDQMCQSEKDYLLGTKSILSQLALQDEATRQKLADIFSELANEGTGVFGGAVMQEKLSKLTNLLTQNLQTAGLIDDDITYAIEEFTSNLRDAQEQCNSFGSQLRSPDFSL